MSSESNVTKVGGLAELRAWAEGRRENAHAHADSGQYPGEEICRATADAYTALLAEIDRLSARGGGDGARSLLVDLLKASGAIVLDTSGPDAPILRFMGVRNRVMDWLEATSGGGGDDARPAPEAEEPLSDRAAARRMLEEGPQLAGDLDADDRFEALTGNDTRVHDRRVAALRAEADWSCWRGVGTTPYSGAAQRDREYGLAAPAPSTGEPGEARPFTVDGKIARCRRCDHGFDHHHIPTNRCVADGCGCEGFRYMPSNGTCTDCGGVVHLGPCDNVVRDFNHAKAIVEKNGFVLARPTPEGERSPGERVAPPEGERLLWTGDNIAEVMAFMHPVEPQYMAPFKDADDLIGLPNGEVIHKGQTIVKLPPHPGVEIPLFVRLPVVEEAGDGEEG